MATSSVNDERAKLLEYNCSIVSANDVLPSKFSQSEKNPNRLYAKCENDKCGYFWWVNVEYAGDEDSRDNEIHPNKDSMDNGVLCNQISRLECDMEARKMEAVRHRAALAAVFLILFFVVFVKG